MSAAINIEDYSHLISGLDVSGYIDSEDPAISALRIDGTVLSCSVSQGPSLTAPLLIHLLTAVEAFSSRIFTPWATPAAVYLFTDADGFDAEIITQECDIGCDEVRLASMLISEIALFLLTKSHDRRIHILIGSDDAHRSFHEEVNPLVVHVTTQVRPIPRLITSHTFCSCRPLTLSALSPSTNSITGRP